MRYTLVINAQFGNLLFCTALGRLLATATDQWVDTQYEILARLQSDKPKIRQEFNVATELGKVTSVIAALSDRHHGGRTVTMISFASGLKLVYKPRNLGMELAFADLMAWFNTHHAPLDFKAPKVLDCSTHGWVEVIERDHHTNNSHTIRRLTRTGMLLCVMYILRATDCHCGNLIYSTEYPVPIDLETLFCPTDPSYLADHEYHVDNWENSVLTTGILPQWQFGNRRTKWTRIGAEMGPAWVTRMERAAALRFGVTEGGRRPTGVTPKQSPRIYPSLDFFFSRFFFIDSRKR